TYYLAALNAPEDVRLAIQHGQIRNLDKAALVAGVEQKDLRNTILEACVQGSSLKELRAMLNQQKQLQVKATVMKMPTRGRQTSKVNMGSTKEAGVIKRIVECVLSHHRYSQYND